MLQTLQSYDGVNLVIFNRQDIPNIRMTLMYSWLTGGDFNIDLEAVIGVTSGEPLGLEEDNFVLFETQFYTPEVEVMVNDDFIYHDSKAKKVVAHLHLAVKKSKQKKQSSFGDKGQVEVVSLDDDSDDFVTQLARQLSGKRAVKDVQPCSAGSSDDFVTQKGRYPPPQELVLSNKRPSKVAKKLRADVAKFVPYNFPHLDNTKSLKELILSKDYLHEHGKDLLVKFTGPNDEPLEVDGNFMYKLFGRAEMMEAEIMDYIISYWKDDPEMKYMFESGDRVLLGPFTIPYLLDFAPFELKDSSGNVLPRSAFDAKQAAKSFKIYVRENENLLKANLIFIPHFWRGHHTVYVMNKYTGTLDIFYSRRYSQLKHTSRSKHHEHRVEIISRMVALMKEVYGISAYNKHNVHQWEVAAERCNFIKAPEQGANECGFYSLKFALTFDGDKIVEKIKNKDSRVEHWKAEYMYQLMFHPKNEISPLQWPSQIQELLLLLGLGSQSTQELVSKAVQERGEALAGK